MKSITQAVILAGGEGKRLRPFTLKNPKPMIPINGRPFLEYLIILLKENGIKELIILTGYLGKKVEKYFGDGSKFGIKIKYSFTPFLNKKGEENQSGIRLKNAEKLLNNFFLLLYCDNFWPLRLKILITHFKQYPSDLLVSAYSNSDNSTRNNMIIKNGYVVRYDPTRLGASLKCVDIGYFIVKKSVLKLLPPFNSKFENVVLPKLVKKRRLAGYLSDQKYYSISDPKRVKLTKKFLSFKKVVFLDRDGVINKKPPKGDYVKKWEKFEFLPKTLKALRLLKDKRYKVFIISNQAGIARGILTVKALSLIHKKMMIKIEEEGGKIDGIYICPHGWDERCECRKPKPGLLLQASKEHFIDLTSTIFIGDDKRDLMAGEAVGCKTFIVNEKRDLLQIVNEILQTKN